jgi:hypothetical protein
MTPPTPQQQTATPISDTPRTDAIAIRLLSMMDMPRSQSCELLIHASQLERDLAAAQAELASARDALEEISTVAHCISKAGQLDTPDLASAWNKFDRISVMATNAIWKITHKSP